MRCFCRWQNDGRSARNGPISAPLLLPLPLPLGVLLLPVGARDAEEALGLAVARVAAPGPAFALGAAVDSGAGRGVEPVAVAFVCALERVGRVVALALGAALVGAPVVPPLERVGCGVAPAVGALVGAPVVARLERVGCGVAPVVGALVGAPVVARL